MNITSSKKGIDFHFSDINSRDSLIPGGMMPFFGKELPPENLDFYPGLLKIEKISLYIFKNEKCFSSFTNFIVPGKVSYIKIKTANENIKIGLHLFPTARFKQKQFPTDLSIYIIDSSGEKKTVELPKKMKEKFLNFLNEGKPTLNFTSLQFVNWMNGVYSENIYEKLDAYMYSTPLVEEKLSVGDTILFINEGKIARAILFIGQGLYFYHLESTCLKVGTLKDILSFTKQDHVEQLHLKSQIIEKDRNQSYLNCEISILSPYLLEDKLFPNEINVYQDITENITKISLKIFKDKFYYFHGRRVQFSIIQITVESNKEYVIGLHLFPITRLHNILPSEINFLIEDRDGNEVQINVPENISRRFLKLLSRGKPHIRFSCFQFMFYLQNMHFKTLVNGSFKKNFHYPIENYSKYFSYAAKSGDSITLFAKNDSSIHSAVYLGEELYIWSLGCLGICVSTLQDMLHCYPASIIKKNAFNYDT